MTTHKHINPETCVGVGKSAPPARQTSTTSNPGLVFCVGQSTPPGSFGPLVSSSSSSSSSSSCLFDEINRPSDYLWAFGTVDTRKNVSGAVLILSCTNAL